MEAKDPPTSLGAVGDVGKPTKQARRCRQIETAPTGREMALGDISEVAKSRHQVVLI